MTQKEHDDLLKIIRDLRDNLEIEKEKNRQLQKLLISEDWKAPSVLNLTPREETILGILFNATKSISNSRLCDLIFHARNYSEYPDPNLISVFVCKIRKKLKAKGIIIEPRFKRGYFIAPSEKEKIRDLYNEE